MSSRRHSESRASAGTAWRTDAVVQLSRRQVIKGAVAVGGALLATGSGLSVARARDQKRLDLQDRFPDNFLWGAAKSGLQHDEPLLADRIGPSMMYTWAHTPGKVPNRRRA